MMNRMIDRGADVRILMGPPFMVYTLLYSISGGDVNS